MYAIMSVYLYVYVQIYDYDYGQVDRKKPPRGVGFLSIKVHVYIAFVFEGGLQQQGK